jgi:peroxiredoxin
MNERRPIGARLCLLLTGLAIASACMRLPDRPVDLNFVLKDADGREINLADYKGKPIVVNFWATWCGPCKVETPYLEALWKKYKDHGFTILGVETESAPAAIKKFAAEYGVTYPLLVGDGRTDIQMAFGYRGILPTSIIVREDGTIAATIVGLRSEEFWEKQIKALLNR